MLYTHTDPSKSSRASSGNAIRDSGPSTPKSMPPFEDYHHYYYCDCYWFYHYKYKYSYNHDNNDNDYHHCY